MEHIHTIVCSGIPPNSRRLETTQIPLTTEWVSNMGCVHITQGQMAMNGNEILAQVTARMYLENKRLCIYIWYPEQAIYGDNK